VSALSKKFERPVIEKEYAWINTYSGKQFHFFEPSLEQICIEDIAHALSNVCRFTGHCREFYSVAQHSYYVSFKVPEEYALWGLLHDAGEAYISDIARPIKYAIADTIKPIENNIMYLVAKKFGLIPEIEPPEVRNADNRMLATERRDIIKKTSEWKMLRGYEPYDFEIKPWPPSEAKKMFIARFKYLTE